MVRIIFLFLMLFLLPSCAYHETQLVDKNEDLTFNKTFPNFYYNGKSIEVVVKQVRGFNMAGIDPIVIDQYLYLDSYHISSGGECTKTFLIDVDESVLKNDWKDNLYWITGARYPGPFTWLNPFGNHSRTIFRMKVGLKERFNQ